MSTGPTVEFTLVTAVYNVARYLDEFIASVESQTFPRDSFEVVAVDDGSTDDSLERLRRWERESGGRVRVLTKENGGQSSARNLGMEHASGRWVTFPDPDDLIESDYLKKVAEFLTAHPGTDMVATHRLMLDDESGEVSNTHPLKMMFRDGDVLRDLSRMCDYFHGSAPAAFFRRARLEEMALRFDLEVRPNFEDGHFCSRYLLPLERPLVGFVRSAKYHYRKRNDSSSTLQNSLSRPERYTHVLRHGYLDVLRRGAAEHGEAPEWLQNFVVYELAWYFKAHDARGGSTAARGVVADEFHALLREVVDYLRPEVIRDFKRLGMRPVWRAILAHAYSDEPWAQDHVVVTAVDDAAGLVRMSYYFTGARPEETIWVGGSESAPLHEKVRDVVSHDRVVLHERIVWLPQGRSIRIQLDGRDLGVRFEPEKPDDTTLWPGVLTRRGMPAVTPPPSVHDRSALAAANLTPEQRRLLRLARTRPVRQRFADAWVLMDRIHDADDSGEHLFHHLRTHRPDVNAWFVLEKHSPDWDRLRAAGQERLVAFGSLQWKLLMLNCRHLISSHADVPIIRPPELAFVEPPWRFTFLQHGVIKDDLSSWLNPKPIEVFVTSTRDEFASIAGDNTTYPFTTKETVLTGLPRFDKLLEAGRAVPETDRDLVLMVPTWRNWLLGPLLSGSQRRRELGREFFDSEFLSRWLELLGSDEVRRACEEQGLELAFLPHPNLQEALPRISMPEHVRSLSFEGVDVRSLFARSAVLVTDYSSVAFNAAYIDRPVVYYQFDAERVRGGEHVGGAGYFDYERDGFGPVTRTREEAEAAICEALARGRGPAPQYAARIDATFPLRDGRCCERVTQAIEDSGRGAQGRGTQ